MRHLLASAVAAIALFASASALAAPAGLDGEGTGRCVEQPMSLSMRIAEAEAGRILPESALASPSDADQVVATPRAGTSGSVHAVSPAPVRPVSMPSRACNSPDDPGCQVSAPVQQPTHAHAGHVDHGFALVTLAPALSPVGVTVHFWNAPMGVGSTGHPRGVLRPPQS